MRLQRGHGLFHVPRVSGRDSEPFSACLGPLFRLRSHFLAPPKGFSGPLLATRPSRGIMLPIEPRLKPLGATIIHFAADTKAPRRL